MNLRRYLSYVGDTLFFKKEKKCNSYIPTQQLPVRVFENQLLDLGHCWALVMTVWQVASVSPSYCSRASVTWNALFHVRTTAVTHSLLGTLPAAGSILLEKVWETIKSWHGPLPLYCNVTCPWYLWHYVCSILFLVSYETLTASSPFRFL